MNSTQKYWYFRFPNTFFHKPEIKYLLAEDNGEKYLIILLKLYAESTEEHGILKIPYDPFHNDGLKKLSVLLDENKDNVKGALEYFVNNNFLKIQDDKENGKVILHFHHVKNSVGISSKKADRQREKYQQEKNKELPEPKPELPDRVPNEEYKAYGKFKNVLLTDGEYSEIINTYENGEFMITRLSIWKAAKQIEIQNDFAQIISFAMEDGVLRNKEKEASKEVYKQAFEKEKAKLKQQDIETEINEKYKAAYPEYAKLTAEKAKLVRKALLLKGEEKAELKLKIDTIFKKIEEFKNTHSID